VFSVRQRGFGDGKHRRHSARMRTFVAVVLFSASVLAEDVPRPAADRLVHHVITPERYAEMLQQITAQAIQGMESQGGQVSPSDRDRFRAMLSEAISYQELSAVTARIYAAHFNDRELDRLLAFYQTDIGAKFLRELPAISGDSMGETMRIIQTRLPNLLQKYGFVPRGSPEAAPPEATAPEAAPPEATAPEAAPPKPKAPKKK
jgi:hypothetical protein